MTDEQHDGLCVRCGRTYQRGLHGFGAAFFGIGHAFVRPAPARATEEASR